jgi:hypothetical protein
MDYESIYVKETGDEKPTDVEDNKLYTILYRHKLIEWQERFSQWLIARLEKAEKEVIELKETKNAYKECFEKYIPTNKCDEATEFLSTYGSPLAKDMARREK